MISRTSCFFNLFYILEYVIDYIWKCEKKMIASRMYLIIQFVSYNTFWYLKIAIIRDANFGDQYQCFSQ